MFKNISKKFKFIVLIKNVIVLSILVAVLFLIKTSDEITPKPLFISALIILIILLLINIIIIPKKYNNYKYYLDEKGIVIKKGVIFKSTSTIYYVNIQDISINQGILSQIFKCATLSISTAGPTEVINSLEIDDAHKIQEEIKNKMNSYIIEE